MDVAIIGAGIGGLAAALRLSHAGKQVEVFETQSEPGGKMRTLPTSAGPVDAGPTVLTMRPVFEKLFNDVGEILSNHITLIPQERLARHFWPDGRTLDLYSDFSRNHEAIKTTFGPKSAREFQAFNNKTKLLFEAFEEPMIYSACPDRTQLNSMLFRRPRLLTAMAPHLTLTKSLARQFSEPQLAQLFGRYATYLGGSPLSSPALLSLIWQAEATGVWQVKGGMHKLAQSLTELAKAKGTKFHFNAPIDTIVTKDGSICGLVANSGTRHKSNSIIFNGDPTALLEGHMGPAVRHATTSGATAPRSHSAYVWSFAATPSRQDLCLHNVFFGQDQTREFSDLKQGKAPTDPTLYIYAQDRGSQTPNEGLERFEIIMNAPATTQIETTKGEIERCRTLTFSNLERMGLTFSPDPKTLTTPSMFNQLYPGSGGALYGRSPHGLMAAFKRPTAKTEIKGLYLAGGGCHPGAGIPMATLSGKHAADAILNDQTSTSTSRQTVTRGGMSMASRTTGKTPSPSSAS